MKYINTRTCYGVETVDELNPKDFNNYKAFRTELIRLFNEYRLAGFNVYISQRCDKTWRD